MKDENEKVRVRVRELEAQTVQLIGDKKDLEQKLEEAILKAVTVEPPPPVMPEVDIDQVFNFTMHCCKGESQG